MTGIYKITNKINNKIYIGKAKNITTRWNQHYLDSFNDNLKDNMVIHKAIRKYGIENFLFEIECLCAPKDLDELEIYYINLYGCQDMDIGYNILPGGAGCAHDGEDNGLSKMTQKEVFDIREAYKNMCHKLDVYEKYKDKISLNTFSDIWTGKTWKSIHYDVYTDEIKKKHKVLRKQGSHASILSEEDVLFIRDCRNDGEPRIEIYEKYFSHINKNTFNDAWTGNTFKYIQSNHPVSKQKRYRSKEQDGILNHMAKFTKEEVISIRKRRDDGEDIKVVYKDYSKRVSIACFRELWKDITYKNI